MCYGTEQRARVVSGARRTAGALGLTIVHFLHGNMLHLEWYGFDGYYFFTPFAENLFDERDAIDAERLQRENARRAARGLAPLANIGALDEAEAPDAVLDEAVEIAADAALLPPRDPSRLS